MKVWVEPVDQFSYFKLGAALTPFVMLPTAVKKYSDVFYQLFEADNALLEFERGPFVHAKEAAREIRVAIARIHQLVRDEVEPGGAPDFNKELQPFHFYQLSKAIGDFQVILARESPKLPVFFIPQKGIAKTDDLIDNADKDFPEPIRGGLPTPAIAEIKQAGKALAFDLFTAYSFHMLRAAEIVMLVLLRDYHNEPIPESGRNWGNYIGIIKKHGGDPELVRYLNEMVRIERNEGIHPTRLLTEVEANMRSTVAKGAIIAMVRDLMNRNFYDSLLGALAPVPGMELAAS